VEGTEVKSGPSLYYATDKNILDALNQSKVDADTIQAMFHRRNIVCSKQTPRKELAEFFSRLTHDSLDHADLSRRLGVSARRERVTAIDLKGALSADAVAVAVDQLKTKLQTEGDSIQVASSNGSTTLFVQYSIIDYKRSEFSQLQHRDGHVEIIPSADGLVLRSTKSDYIDAVRDALVHGLQEKAPAPLERAEITLTHHTDHVVRSRFFFDLISTLPGYVRKDVTDVYVFKARPKQEDDEDSEPDESHVERVALRGVGVSQSEILSSLTKEKSYYIVKIGWIATETFGAGRGFDIEATFAEPESCIGFSYILRGVHELGDDGKLSMVRRPPTTSEIDTVSRAIENKARALLATLDEAAQQAPKKAVKK
jgi:hypothetical protein